MKIEPIVAYAVCDEGKIKTMGKSGIPYHVYSCNQAVNDDQICEQVHIAPTSTHDIVKKGEWLAEMPTVDGWYWSKSKWHGTSPCEVVGKIIYLDDEHEYRTDNKHDLTTLRSFLFYSVPINMPESQIAALKPDEETPQ